MRTATRRVLAVFGFTLLISGDLMGETARPGTQGGIPPEVVAEYVYAIVQADRNLYTTHVVERMEALMGRVRLHGPGKADRIRDIFAEGVRTDDLLAAFGV